MEKLRRAFERFEKALRKFKEALTNPLFEETFSREFQVEILTKRFEYSFEALWKTVEENAFKLFQELKKEVYLRTLESIYQALKDASGIR